MTSSSERYQNIKRLFHIKAVSYLVISATASRRRSQGVQPLLDGVVDYLPNPLEVSNFALDTANEEQKVSLLSVF